MDDLVCAKCDGISDETFGRLVQSGRLPPGAERRPRAVCFLRNEGVWEVNDSTRAFTWLEPACELHRGECFLTVVSLEDGMGEYSVQVVMGS